MFAFLTCRVPENEQKNSQSEQTENFRELANFANSRCELAKFSQTRNTSSRNFRKLATRVLLDHKKAREKARKFREQKNSRNFPPIKLVIFMIFDLFLYIYKTIFSLFDFIFYCLSTYSLLYRFSNGRFYFY
jgi:hypothetical protein